MKTHEEIAAAARKLAEQLRSWNTLVGYTLRDLANLIADTNEAAAARTVSIGKFPITPVEADDPRLDRTPSMMPDPPKMPKPRRRR